LQRACRYQLIRSRERLSRVQIDVSSASLRDAFGRRQQRVDELRFRIEAAWREKLAVSTERCNATTARLMRQDARHRLRLLRERLASLDTRLGHLAATRVQTCQFQLQHFEGLLQGLSPLAVLQRGYALVYDASGALVRSAAAVGAGDTITTRFADNSLTSRVLSTEGTARSN
jgi:exodeoxyribonuclease VII large subunit